jgi:hypothetical protein
MSSTLVPVLPPNTTVKLDVVSDEKHVVLIIQDIEQIAATILRLAGKDKMADGLLAIGALAEVALEGYEDGASVQINLASILATLPQSTPLAPATDATEPETNNAAAQTKPTE